MTTKYCKKGYSGALERDWGSRAIISENPKRVKFHNSENRKQAPPPRKTRRAAARITRRFEVTLYFSWVRPAWVFAALRARPAALARKRSIWPLGRVTQISPIHSSFTPLIGLALKLLRLTRADDFPRSMVFR